MIDPRIQYLFDKYRGKSASEEERNELFAWIVNPANKSAVASLMHGHFETEFSEFSVEAYEIEQERILKNIISSQMTISSESNVPGKGRMYLKIAAAIAACLLSFFVINYFIQKQASIHKENLLSNELYNIPAGGNKAILTLTNGKKILLDTLKIGQVIVDGNMEISKALDGQLTYAFRDGSVPSQQFNSVETPVGGNYQIVLPDGTKVWLNALSNLQYPTNFDSKIRKVKLKGEAYFEVAKDRNRPFIVDADGLDVRVLGTHFNINSYSKQQSTKTTVMEGAVSVRQGAQDQVIYPNQQLQAFADGSFKLIEQVDVENVIAWKSGLFTHSAISFSELMEEVSRWYGVTIQYEEPIDTEIVFKINKNISLRELITILELTEEFKFELTKNTLKVMKRPYN